MSWANFGYFILTLVVTAGLFVLVSQKFMYQLTQKLTGLIGWTSSQDGVPNMGGLILHGIVLGLLIALLWYILSLIFKE